ncbi:MAG: DNA polymerase III subunit alpha [Elusimicrobiota bacterium]|jgi:DNA polymerase-3 subunit alpha
MERTEFVHLHSHTEYSLLDGAARLTDEKGKPGELLKMIAAMNMPALALTDHGNLYGAIEFYRAAKAVGVKPIIGCEMYMAPKSRLDRESTRGQEDAFYHLTVLARDNEGYQNLIKLCSIGFLEGYYYKPRVDKEVLAKYGKGLIVLSGCLKGELAQALLADRHDEALRIVETYQSLFGKENYYLEVMDHGLPEQRRLNEKLLELSKKTDVPLVATNDCHYLRKEDAPAHDALLCIGTGSTLSEPSRLRFSAEEFYYKSAEDMYGLFKPCPQAVRQTLEIADRCNVDIRFDQMLLPHYEVPAGETPDTYLEKLCLEGLTRRYGTVEKKYSDRLLYELSVIRKMGFSTYFLIVWDFVYWAKTNGVPVGPGRGSGAGSLVAYVLGITDICPVKYGLLFERFLNPDRRTMPDLDIDFSDGGRERVIQYVRQKYGETSVAQIITFGSMLARLVVRDVGRVLGIPISEVDRIAKLIPRELGTTIAMARKSVPELEQECKKNPDFTQLLNTAERLEGLKRHTGVHAAGIVIAKGDLTQYVPLAKGSKDVVTTQYDGDGLLRLGLLKMDFLGLRTLTVIEHTCRLIRERRRPDFDLATIPLNDAVTFALLQEARAIGVFQLESSGMRDLLRKIHPTVFEDIIALIALYRPGPMGAGMLDDFVKRKHNPAIVKYDHPVLEPILKETYGVILYQEQVMRISMDIGGFTPGQADGLRKAMGKKIPEEIEKQRDAFMKGALAKKIPEKIAKHVFEQIVFFGGYGFNKSHSTAYGMVSYQTAFLKANFPMEYMAALLTSEIGHSAIGKEEDSKLVVFLAETEAMGIRVLTPDVQKSFSEFSIEEVVKNPENGPVKGPGKRPRSRAKPVAGVSGGIRFGLLAVKNVGSGAVESIVSNRQSGGPYASFEDFCQRIDLRQANRKVLESMVKSGALDSLSPQPPAQSRAQMMADLDEVMARSAKIREEILSGQTSLFEMNEVSTSRPAPSSNGRAKAVTAWSDHELLAAEKEVLGFYLSGHPLARYQSELGLLSTHRLDALPTAPNAAVRLAGMISSVRRLLTKARKEPYARCRFEDLQGEVDLIIFPRSYAEGLSQHLKPGAMMVVTGRVNRREETSAEIVVEEMVPLSAARERYVSEMLVRLSSPGLEESVLTDLKATLSRHPGRCRVCFEVATPPGGTVVVETDFQVKPSEALFKELEQHLGQESWTITRVGR